MKKFFLGLFSDSNKVSSKRFIGLISLVMFVAYGIKGLFNPFNLQFWVFYLSLCSITIWIAFKFMSSEKALKYNILGQLSNFRKIKEGIDDVMENENIIDESIQPSDEKND